MTSLVIILALALATSLTLCVWLWIRPGRSVPTTTPATEPSTLASASPPLAHDAMESLAHPLFQAAASVLDVGIIIVDCARTARFLNHYAEELLGIAPEMVGQSLIAALRDHQADALVAEVLRDGEPRELAMQPISSGRTIQLRCMPLVLTRRAVGAMLLIRDITQLSMLERSRRDLVANVSHELRTPLASLKLLVETIQSEPPPAVSRRMLGQMAQEIDSITQLVDELHELSQIESGRVTLKLAPQSIQPVVARALERIRPQADRKRIALGTEISAATSAVLMDADRIGQVLLNLLHNAVKFTPVGGVVAVRVDLVLNDGGTGPWLCVSVSDTGMGVSPQDLPRIFERFYKVDRSRTRNAGGTGLGLAIAKHLVEGHGGRLWADSAEGRGSTFHFTLPLA